MTTIHWSSEVTQLAAYSTTTSGRAATITIELRTADEYEAPRILRALASITREQDARRAAMVPPLLRLKRRGGRPDTATEAEGQSNG